MSSLINLRDAQAENEQARQEDVKALRLQLEIMQREQYRTAQILGIQVTEQSEALVAIQKVYDLSTKTEN